MTTSHPLSAAPTRRKAVGAALAALLCPPSRAQAQTAGVAPDRFAKLVESYPDHLRAIEPGRLVWRDGFSQPLDDGLSGKSFEQMLRTASIADQMRQIYTPGKPAAPPPFEFSPGRIRNETFFARMYGDCRRNEVAARMKTLVFMPRTKPQKLQVTTINDVIGHLGRVVDELERLPDRFKAWLIPSSGTYNCRVVADTGKPSMHASGAAIDINASQTDYWVWAGKKAGGPVPYKNRIPFEIVEIFEAEKFIWGGKWYHYDTMHFEYRPECFA
jgi:hypothetical protein